MPPERKPIRKSLLIHQDKTNSMCATIRKPWQYLNQWKTNSASISLTRFSGRTSLPEMSVHYSTTRCLYHTGISAIYPQRRQTNQISFNKKNNVAYCNG